MEKYVTKIKSALNGAIEIMLSKQESIKLVSGYTLVISRMDSVSVLNFSEIKLMDFVSGRKFEVDGEGACNLFEKVNSGEKPKQVLFSFKKSVVTFNDATQEFDVLTLGEFAILKVA